MMRVDLWLCAGLVLVLAALVLLTARAGFFDPLPVAVASNTPTAFDAPGIPVLRPAP